MAKASEHRHDTPSSNGARYESDGILPLAVRQRLWDQIWARLLAPPVDPADKAPAPKNRDARDGGQQ